MDGDLASLAIVVARILIGALFVIGGLRHFKLLEPITEAMVARGVPMPRAVLIAGSVFQLTLGATLALGLFATLSALGLILFTVLASVMLVNFWDKAEPERSALLGVFMSNIAIIGGLLAVAAAG